MISIIVSIIVKKWRHLLNIISNIELQKNLWNDSKLIYIRWRHPRVSSESVIRERNLYHEIQHFLRDMSNGWYITYPYLLTFMNDLFLGVLLNYIILFRVELNFNFGFFDCSFSIRSFWMLKLVVELCSSKFWFSTDLMSTFKFMCMLSI